MASFNSLSRDHLHERARLPLRGRGFQLPLSGSQARISLSVFARPSSLSTPSLGITDEQTSRIIAFQTRTFNSLSRDHYPNDCVATNKIVNVLSTPSLGIT